MKCQSLLMRFSDCTYMVYFIFIMSAMMFFFIRVFAFYWIGGDFYSHRVLIRSITLRRGRKVVKHVATANRL